MGSERDGERGKRGGRGGGRGRGLRGDRQDSYSTSKPQRRDGSRSLSKKKVVYDTEEAAEEAHEQEVCKKVKGYLNKLTIEKFDSISGHFLELPITTPSLLKKVIALIFDKALDEHYFQNMYGRLCLRHSNELPTRQEWIDMDQKNNAFCRLLLNKSQEEFELYSGRIN
ncbi:Eukaryotic translation initiation factor 4 gamma 1 [Rhizoclosmatium hyalinum]|nr:Eukaryotic translation initiation factor 4 gamma 1 [Rhizoclosmatium hyalinum]